MLLDPKDISSLKGTLLKLITAKENGQNSIKNNKVFAGSVNGESIPENWLNIF